MLSKDTSAWPELLSCSQNRVPSVIKDDVLRFFPGLPPQLRATALTEVVRGSNLSACVQPVAQLHWDKIMNQCHWISTNRVRQWKLLQDTHVRQVRSEPLPFLSFVFSTHEIIQVLSPFFTTHALIHHPTPTYTHSCRLGCPCLPPQSPVSLLTQMPILTRRG